LTSARGWLLLNAVCAFANAAPPPAPPPAPPASSKTPASAADAPDDEFLEFLGSDDVGDAALWEYLKRVPSRGNNPPPPPPPQEAKK
jgi:hypothetical protein